MSASASRIVITALAVLGIVGAVVAATSAREAIYALKAMRSVVQAGVTYDDYSRRLLDATIVVDRYLDEAKSPATKRTISDAISHYQRAKALWRAKIDLRVGGFPLTMVEPLRANNCPAVRTVVSAAIGTRSKEELTEYVTEQTADALISALWSCAADKIAEAEKLLAGDKK